ncbi:tetratricopeptide repeat protein [bacterium]|nr:tetratricopeptide repeat protein [bacterium]
MADARAACQGDEPSPPRALLKLAPPGERRHPPSARPRVPIELLCHSCRAAISVPSGDGSSKTRCPRCGAEIEAHLLPGAARASTPSVEEAWYAKTVTHEGPPPSGRTKAFALPKLEPDSLAGEQAIALEVEKARADPKRALGRFLLLTELGKGGMGTVYRAWDERLRRVVALKTLRPGDVGTRSERFEREAEVIARLRHPNIVAIHDAGEIDGQAYIAMELVLGSSLAQRLVATERTPKIPLTKALEVVRDAARAVEHAHEQGVVHRDLKPQNIMIDRTGRAVVLDFGLAKLRDQGSSLTKTGTTLGTPAYMPPEQAGGSKTIDARSDVYSLGATLYHVLTGKTPFEGDTEYNVLAAVVMREPDPPGLVNPRVAGDLETICLRCLEKEPEKRYQTARELADDIDRYLAGDPIAARPVSSLSRLLRRARRHKLTSSLALLLVLGAAGGAVALGRERARLERKVREDARASAERALRALETERALARKGGPARARADALLLLGLDAYEAGLHSRELSPDDPGARALAFEASIALGEVALEAEQWTLATGVFERARSLHQDDARARKALERVETARQKLQEEHRKTIGVLLERARSGTLEAADAYDEALFALVALREPQTVKLLGKALDDVSAALELALKNDRKDALSTGQERTSKLACEALGWIGLRDGATLPLARFLRAVPASSQLVAVPPALALCRLKGSEAEEALVLARNRFGIESFFWRQTSHAFGRIGGETKLDVASADGYFQRAKTLLDKGELDRALEDLARAIEIDPSGPGAWSMRGVALYRKGELDGAIADSTRAIELDPRYAGAWANRGSARYRKGELDAALSDCSHAIELDPLLADAWTNRGIVREDVGDRAGALADMTRAIELDPKNPLRWANRGIALQRRGDRDGALADVNRALELDPRHANAWTTRGSLSQAKGDLDGACSDYSRAIELDPRQAKAWTSRAEARAFKGDLDGAIADYTRGLELDGSRANPWANRGIARWKQGDADGALADLTRAIELDPAFAGAWLNRARVRDGKGDIEGATADYSRFLEAAPRDPQAEVVRARLGELERKR